MACTTWNGFVRRRDVKAKAHAMKLSNLPVPLTYNQFLDFVREYMKREKGLEVTTLVEVSPNQLEYEVRDVG